MLQSGTQDPGAASMLTVLNIAHPLAPVGTDAVGGAEQVLAAIDEHLVARGHRSIVIASERSKIAGELVGLPALEEALDHATWLAAHDACRAAMRRTLARERIDVIHLHGSDFHAYLPPPGPPVLATLHMPIAWYPGHVFEIARPRTFVHCVSRTQQRDAAAGANLLDPIENGVDLERLRPAATRGDHVLVLGRICPEKAPHLALDAATAANVPLVLAGTVFGFAEHQRYFRDQIEPRLRPPHRFVGPVAGAAKTRLLAEARCVIVPTVIGETSSLVAMEALACGTPVIGFRRGALAELVEDGRTGQLVDHPDQLAAAIAAWPRYDRARCRELAEQRCSQRRMCERYVARYAELAHDDGHRPQPGSARSAELSAGPSAGLSVEVVDRGGLDALAPAWDELWQRSADATVFQRAAWCIAWCDRLLDGQPEVIVVRRGGRIDAVLPMFRWRDGGGDVLSMIGAGVSDYQDALVAPGATDAFDAAAAVLAHRPWDRIELSELADGSPLLHVRTGLAGSDEVTEQEPCPALRLPDADPLAALPPSLGREIAYQRRRAARELGIDCACLAPGEIVPALARLHGARWRARGEGGVLTARRCAFLGDVIARLPDQVVGAGVRLGGELAAVALVLLDRSAARYYLGGFDPAHAHRGPGMLAIASAIEHAHARGARLFDLLRGAEPYKYRLGAHDRVRLHRRVIRRPAAGAQPAAVEDRSASASGVARERPGVQLR